mmetsp:Transcript_6982/g.17548  ORF Transcript_6982/g.17548 Transcript_6982/m.17548 type:complete len:202 (+) Transcript_6982:71-676(+)
MNTPLYSPSIFLALPCWEPMITEACFGLTVITCLPDKSKARNSLTHSLASSVTPCTIKLFDGGDPLARPLPPSGRSMTTPCCFSNLDLYKKLRTMTSGGSSTFVVVTDASSTSSGFKPLAAATRAAMRFLSLPARTSFAVTSFSAMRLVHLSRKVLSSSWNLAKTSHLCAFESSCLLSSNISNFISSVNEESVVHCRNSVY